jgi:pyridoxine 5-phosphate synthase
LLENIRIPTDWLYTFLSDLFLRRNIITHLPDNLPLLGVNIDHVATLRQARGIDYPDPTEAALLAERAGADYITLHLREDRRHIQEHDVWRMRERLTTYMNLEMAMTDAMLTFALSVKPRDACIVPENRQELTTEGGLDVLARFEEIKAGCETLVAAGIRVSLFIDASFRQIDAAKAAGSPVIEIHTGHYASASGAERQGKLEKILSATDYAHSLGLIVNAGHGLNNDNVSPVAAHPLIAELNIGHSIIARALTVGIEQAVAEMKASMLAARRENTPG